MPPRAAKNLGAAATTGEGQTEGANTATFNGNVPSAADQKFVFSLVTNFKTKPEFDWDKIAELSGLKGKKSAYERWRVFRIKYGITLPEDDAGQKSAKKTTGPPAKANATADANNNDNDNGVDNEGDGDNVNVVDPAPVTPAKHGRKKSASAAIPGSTASKKRGAPTAASAADAANGNDNETNDGASPGKKAKPSTAKNKPIMLAMNQEAAAVAVPNSSPLSSPGPQPRTAVDGGEASATEMGE